MQKVKVLIATDSYIVSKGLHLILSEVRSVQLHHHMIESGSLITAIAHLKPQILIVSSPLASEIELNTNQLLKSSPETKIVGLVYSNIDFAQQMQCYKKIELSDSKEVITEHLVSLVDEFLESDENETENSEISQREKMILKHVAMGHSNKEIADKLFISMHTVITHRKKITRKLGIKTISGLTVYAIINGLLGMEDIEN